MISRDVVDFFALADPVDDMPHNFHVTLRPVPFAELPDINDIPIEDYNPGSDGLEIREEVFGAATVGAQVNIGKNENVYSSSTLHDLDYRSKVSRPGKNKYPI